MRFNITHQSYNASSAWTHACITCDDVEIRYLITFDCIDGAHYVHAGMDVAGEWMAPADSWLSQSHDLMRHMGSN